MAVVSHRCPAEPPPPSRLRRPIAVVAPPSPCPALAASPSFCSSCRRAAAAAAAVLQLLSTRRRLRTAPVDAPPSRRPAIKLFPAVMTCFLPSRPGHPWIWRES
ncbi:hypothetical protein ACP70R_032497 [Stipagrostis hirtigluma subsp. patula]